MGGYSAPGLTGLGALALMTGLPGVVGTIAGERLDLSRLLQLSRWSVAAYSTALGLSLSGVVLSLAASALGARLSGLAWCSWPSGSCTTT